MSSDSDDAPFPIETGGCENPPLHLINVKTLQLESFSAPGPSYAILSHTWEGAEVSYRELRRRPAIHKEGYAKIQGACLQALRDGLNYLWVDTCCINKSNNAELAESITSMFKWYKSASICYVYMRDVRANVKLQLADADIQQVVPGSSLQKTLSAFQDSRWFTRGWTLQELLASPRIIFFGSDWCELCSLGDVASYVSFTTKVPVEALNHQKPLKEYSAAQKISWMAERTTTRLEDMTYSLFGICDVSFSANYGEGAQAFRRLQQKILMKGDLSVLAWQPSRDTSELFATSPTDFLGKGWIEPRPLQSGGPELSLSSAGLIGYMLLSTELDGIVTAFLGFGVQECPEQSVGIFLRKIDDTVSEYRMVSIPNEEMLPNIRVATIEAGFLATFRRKRLTIRATL
ncbi:hypothetical protein MBLNU230_g0614t1 [Neophaeotheca triangularis]